MQLQSRPEEGQRKQVSRWLGQRKERALINTLMLTMWCQYVWAECKQDLRKVRKTVKTAGGCVRGKKEP